MNIDKSLEHHHKSRNGILCTTIITLLISIVFIGIANSKSLYLNTQEYVVRAYDIGANGFTLTHQYDGSTPTWGGVGITLDGEHALPILFLTYEGQGYVEIMNANTMVSLGTVSAAGSSNLAGIAYDEDNDRLYCVDRYNSILYVYDWDYTTKILTPVAGSPFSMPGTYTFDIVLDQTNNRLYISNYSTTINVYNLNNDGAPFSITPTTPITTMYTSVSLGIDEGYQFLYYGVGSIGGSSPIDLRLNQYNLTAGTEVAYTLTSNGVVGLDIDQTNHNVYISTNGGDNLMVFDSALNLLSTLSSGVSRPTGLVIPRGAVSYNPLNLTKASDVPAGGTRGNGQQITYTLTYDNASGATQVDNATLVDKLPPEVDFVSANGGGTYNSGTREVSWDLGNLPAGYTGDSRTLVVTVNSTVPASGKIINSATIDSDHTPPTTVTNEVDWATGPSIATISGTFYDPDGIGVPGATVTFSNGGGTVTTDPYGFYYNVVAIGWNGTATPYKVGLIFSPPQYVYTNVTTSISMQDFVTSRSSVNISGHVYDIFNNGISGVDVTISNGGATITTDTQGFYTTSVTNGWGGTSTATKDDMVFSPENYTYSAVTTDLIDQDFVGSQVQVAIEYDFSSLPDDFILLPAYPNPFNPSTTITYGLDRDSNVNIAIYDISGKLITTLLNTEQSQGWHSVQWNGTDSGKNHVPAGVYLTRIISDNNTKTNKLMLLK